MSKAKKSNKKNKKSNFITIPKTLKLNVIQKDIDNGAIQEGDSCAIAQCLKRSLKDITEFASVDVSGSNDITVNFTEPEGWGDGISVEYKVTGGYKQETKVDNFIEAFDGEEKVTPISFAIALKE